MMFWELLGNLLMAAALLSALCYMALMLFVLLFVWALSDGEKP
jgi:hypothetical protein